MKLNSKVYRKAANHIWKYHKQAKRKFSTLQRVKGIAIRYSCIAIEDINPGYEQYCDIYQNIFSSRLHKFISVSDIERQTDGQIKPTKQTQLHRALMLDFMAEMIEQGDL